ncbi:hypothetical protein EDC19_0901 [Natranaerovirga hydrolytica]|uniref:Uncharacterized protein n=1 Tax=Natranaerovirga hydrolytica TaxID=680378 RepID=A0A4R1N633_9FIRM|nr:hypothetical protein EDC19_0901 [Natranaerovirga hydrolytica]
MVCSEKSKKRFSVFFETQNNALIFVPDYGKMIRVYYKYAIIYCVL